jgi:hypothetical protein
MPYREIADDDGDAWIVFSTQPRSGANVRPQYAGGWLSFQRGDERRRLFPIPSAWEAAGDDQLRLWLRSSELVALSAEDEEAVLGMSTERRGAPAARGDVAAGDPKAEDIAPPAEPHHPSGEATGPARRLQKSVERIREMLSGIRGDIT